VRQWNEGGAELDGSEQLVKRAGVAAQEGVVGYREFFKALTPAQRKALGSVHAENKATAERVDREQEAAIPEVDKLPDAIEQVVGTLMRCGGSTWLVVDSEDGYRWTERQEAT
jgi:hypothetical protein